MGNCNSQFQNVEEDNIQWASKNRNYGQLIGQKHLTFDPTQKYNNNMQNQKDQINNHQSIINPDVIHYDIILPDHSKNLQSKIIAKNKLRLQDELKHTLQYDSTFYDSLHLPEYLYKKINNPQYKGTQYKPTQDRRGVKYLGEWKNGFPHGKGILISNTEKYIGWFYKGAKHEHGRQILADQVYQGPFVYGKRKGIDGKLYKKDQTQQGQFDLVLINGKIHYHQDHSVYQGPLINGIRQAEKAKFTWKDGTIYIGSFKDDKINGYGQMKYLDGRIYRGEFLDQKKHGKGTFKWPKNGYDQTYTGQYVNDLKHGKGKFQFSKTQYYEGNFQYGKPHGEGIVKDQNGIIRKSQFCYGKQIKKVIV